MKVDTNQPISLLIRSARRARRMSQNSLARELVTVSGRPTITRDLVARWERGHQIPRSGTRRWLSVVLGVAEEQLEIAAVASRRRSRLGHAVVTSNAPAQPGHARRVQGTPALLPVFRSRVQAGILAATLLNPDRSFSLTELAKYAGGSLASVDKENKLLEEAGILTSRRAGTIRLIRADNRNGVLTGPLTELIRLTYGVPQVVAEEFGSVEHIGRMVLGGAWADRFAGIPGPEPESFELLLAALPEETLDHEAVATAVARTEQRLGRPVRFGVVPRGAKLDTREIPHQRPGHPVVEVVAIRPRTAKEPAGIALDGRPEIKRLLRAGQLEMVSGPAADGRPFLRLAADYLGSAEPLAESSPKSAFVLLSRAAQLIGSALLAHQGLRPSATAAEHVVGTAATAQLGHRFSQIELLRQRAKELDVPTSCDSRAMPVEATTYLGTVRSLLTTADELLDKISLFT